MFYFFCLLFFFKVVKWSQLREIDAGLMDSLTYEYVAAEMPQEYEARKKDKLRYRWVEAAGCLWLGPVDSLGF